MAPPGAFAAALLVLGGLAAGGPEGPPPPSPSGAAPPPAPPPAERLLRALLSRYRAGVRPAGPGGRVLVGVGLELAQLVSLDEKHEELTTRVYLHLSWQDPRLRWDPPQFGGVGLLRVPPQDLWLPDLGLHNNNDGGFGVSLGVRAVVTPDGTVRWRPPALYRSHCPIRNCSLVFRSGSYGPAELGLRLGGGDPRAPPGDPRALLPDAFQAFAQELRLARGLCMRMWFCTRDLHKDGSFDSGICTRTGLRTLYLHNENSQWQLCHRSGRHHAGLHEDVTFYLVLRRKPLFYIVNVLVPCVLLTLLAVSVFYLPPDAGEKMTLSLFALLTLTVFLLLTADKVPATSLALPLLGRYLTGALVLLTLCVALSVTALGLHHRPPRGRALPAWAHALLLQRLPPLLGLHPPAAPPPPPRPPAPPPRAGGGGGRGSVLPAAAAARGPAPRAGPAPPGPAPPPRAARGGRGRDVNRAGAAGAARAAGAAGRLARGGRGPGPALPVGVPAAHGRLRPGDGVGRRAAPAAPPALPVAGRRVPPGRRGPSRTPGSLPDAWVPPGRLGPFPNSWVPPGRLGPFLNTWVLPLTPGSPLKSWVPSRTLGSLPKLLGPFPNSWVPPKLLGPSQTPGSLPKHLRPSLNSWVPSRTPGSPLNSWVLPLTPGSPPKHLGPPRMPGSPPELLGPSQTPGSPRNSRVPSRMPGSPFNSWVPPGRLGPFLNTWVLPLTPGSPLKSWVPSRTPGSLPKLLGPFPNSWVPPKLLGPFLNTCVLPLTPGSPPGLLGPP
ncbi:acetylcholine receptor subunit beta isoform X2 [Patagioenas fasciata]|uniref:acetylcholine receptor subunit beta isoform X2 n=1 Tax=Patagioenas fasciata TaxID=372321 RepID=UPI003A9A430A